MAKIDIDRFVLSLCRNGYGTLSMGDIKAALFAQGLKYKDGEIVSIEPETTTKAGNWYVCNMEVMNENMTTAFHRNELYYCPKDGYIDVNGALFKVGTLDVFRPATEEEIERAEYEQKIHPDSFSKLVEPEETPCEPEFKVGDWIVNYEGCEPKQIKAIGKWRYYLNDEMELPFLSEGRYRLWTIQDAKEGDVLASKDGDDILIFRNVEGNVSFSSYYNIARKIEHHWLKSRFIPATKEQSDLLFQKMHESGYEWDAEKKVLHNKPESNKLTEFEQILISLIRRTEKTILTPEGLAKEFAPKLMEAARKEIASEIDVDAMKKGIIDTLEVKEVDLKKEIDEYICNNFFGSQTLGFFANRTKEEPNYHDIALCAKHFFELGLKAQKGE